MNPKSKTPTNSYSKSPPNSKKKLSSQRPITTNVLLKDEYASSTYRSYIQTFLNPDSKTEANESTISRKRYLFFSNPTKAESGPRDSF